MMIDSVVAEGVILARGIEDYCPLAEALGEIDAVYPRCGLAERYEAADAALRSLLKRRWIVLFRAETSGGAEARREKLGSEQVDAVLRDHASWYPEHEGWRIEFASTKAGDKAYQAGELPLPE